MASVLSRQGESHSVIVMQDREFREMNDKPFPFRDLA